MALASFLLIIANSLSTFMPSCDRCDNEIYTMVLIGIAYCVYGAAFWGSVPCLVPPHTIGTAYGIVNSFQNFGVFISTIIASQLQVHTTYKEKGYFWPQFVFIIYSVLSFIVHIALLVTDKKHYGG